jgi:RNA methyltransferase, TrmH family
MMAAAQYISSRHNPLIQELKNIQESRGASQILLEGPRLAQEAIAAGLTIEMLILRENFPDNPLIEQLRRQAQREFHLANALFHSLSDVETPQGIFIVCPKPLWQWPQLLLRRPRPVVVLDGVQDPGNAASIVRTAEAAGAAGVWATTRSASLFSPKALRGAMGSSLRLPVLEKQTVEQTAQSLAGAGYRLVGASSAKDPSAKDYTAIDWTQPTAIVLGQEGQGLSDEWSSLLQERIAIPMESPVESLNVAAAAAVLLYEARRRAE